MTASRPSPKEIIEYAVEQDVWEYSWTTDFVVGTKTLAARIVSSLKRNGYL